MALNGDVVNVEPRLVRRSIEWMTSMQGPDGSFPEPGKVFNKNMQVSPLGFVYNTNNIISKDCFTLEVPVLIYMKAVNKNIQVSSLGFVHEHYYFKGLHSRGIYTNNIHEGRQQEHAGQPLGFLHTSSIISGDFTLGVSTLIYTKIIDKNI